MGGNLLLIDGQETVSLREAAIRLGISKQAATKRLARGSLVGEKVDGEWRVLLPDEIEANGSGFTPRGIDLTLQAKEQVIETQQRYIASLEAEVALLRDGVWLALQAPQRPPRRAWWRFWRAGS